MKIQLKVQSYTIVMFIIHKMKSLLMHRPMIVFFIKPISFKTLHQYKMPEKMEI